MPAFFVWLGEYGDSLYAKFFTRSNNPNSYLTAIGDQNFVKHLFFPNQEPRLFQASIKRLFAGHRRISPKKISFKTPEVSCREGRRRAAAAAAVDEQQQPTP
jgi:hypothetical protein